MTTPHRTLQMALDALDAITDDVDGTGLNTMPSFDKAIDAIAALREALAAPEPEPVAWEGAEEWMQLAWHLCAEENGEDACNELIWEGGPIKQPWGERWLKYEGEAKRMIALVREYAAPPAAPDHFRDAAEKVAPAAPVVPLTEGRITAIANELAFGGGHCNVYELARAIEAAHGITGGKP